MSLLKPIIGKRVEYTVHGRDEKEWEVVSKVVRREQLEEFKARAKALKDARG